MALLSSGNNDEKIRQSYCHYRQGDQQANCGTCHHYTQNSCEIVQDPITAPMVCDFFCPAQQQGGGLLGGPMQGGGY